MDGKESKPERLKVPEYFDDLETIFYLAEEFERQMEILQKIGLLEILESGQLGFVDIEGNECPVPSTSQLRDYLEEYVKGGPNHDLLAKKWEQGFKEKPLLVPFGMPLSKIIEAY